MWGCIDWLLVSFKGEEPDPLTREAGAPRETGKRMSLDFQHIKS